MHYTSRSCNRVKPFAMDAAFVQKLGAFRPLNPEPAR
jgi:hypothetical protein